MPRLKQRTPELRDRLLQAAVAMLADEGVTGFTTRKVAQGAQTSVPAVYELFGDRAGLVREIYFEGFRQLRARLEEQPETDDPRADVVAFAVAFRGFVVDNPVLAQVMFSRPFTDFDPGPTELRANRSVREFLVRRVRRCCDAGLIVEDETDVAHSLLALAQGLSAQETAGWLGTSKASQDRRWALAFRALLDGLGTATAPPDRRRAGPRAR